MSTVEKLSPVIDSAQREINVLRAENAKLKGELENAEASIQQAREFICFDLCNGQIGGGDDPVGFLIALCQEKMLKK